jgi:hypothetical protein
MKAPDQRIGYQNIGDRNSKAYAKTAPDFTPAATSIPFRAARDETRAWSTCPQRRDTTSTRTPKCPCVWLVQGARKTQYSARRRAVGRSPPRLPLGYRAYSQLSHATCSGTKVGLPQRVTASAEICRGLLTVTATRYGRGITPETDRRFCELERQCLRADCWPSGHNFHGDYEISP